MALAALGKREGCFKKRLASLPVFTLAFLFFSFLLPFSSPGVVLSCHSGCYGVNPELSVPDTSYFLVTRST